MAAEGLGAVRLGRPAGARRVDVGHGDEPRARMRRIVPRMVRSEISETDDADPDWFSLRHAFNVPPNSPRESVADISQACAAYA